MSLVAGLWALGGLPLRGQGAPPTLSLTITPPANFVMVTQTVNAVFVRLANAANYTNVTVDLQPPYGPLAFLDGGAPPDATANDGTFSANFTAPALTNSTNITLTFIARGNDLSLTNDLGEVDTSVVISGTNKVTYVIVTRPANDKLVDAFKILPGGGLVTGATNNYAWLEPGEPKHGNDPIVDASVWWTWSPLFNTNVLIDTAGSSFPPVLGVYRGLTVGALQEVASSTNDIRNGLKANVTFDAVAGVTYRIAIAGYNSNGVGNIRLRVAPGWQPDTRGPLVTILNPATETLVSQSNVVIFGTAKDAEPFASGISNVLVQVNNDPPKPASGIADWSAQIVLPPGTNTVTATALDYAGNLGRAQSIVIRYLNPTNDNFASAIALSDVGGRITAITGRATREPGEPFHGGNDGGHSIWYSFRAPVTGEFTADTQGSSFDTLLGLYTGTSVSNLTTIVGNDDVSTAKDYSFITATLLAGETYYLAVDGYGGESGNVTLNYAFTTIEHFFTLLTRAPVGGSVTPPSGLYQAGSTQLVTALPARDFQFVGWDGSVVSTENPLRLVLDQNHDLTARFRVIGYTDGFESGGFGSHLTWTAAGDAPWLVQSNVVATGAFAARSGAIGDGQSSSLVLNAVLIAGTVSFDARTSSENGWDRLEFYLNGTLLKSWTGVQPWENFQVQVAAGLNKLEWRYVKDANFAAGLDAAFLDNLYLPLPDTSFAAHLTLVALDAASVQLQVQGSAGRTYVVQRSADLATWAPVHTNSTPSGSFTWLDTIDPQVPARFYRAEFR